MITLFWDSRSHHIHLQVLEGDPNEIELYKVVVLNEYGIIISMSNLVDLGNIVNV